MAWSPKQRPEVLTLVNEYSVVGQLVVLSQKHDDSGIFGKVTDICMAYVAYATDKAILFKPRIPASPDPDDKINPVNLTDIWIPKSAIDLVFPSGPDSAGRDTGFAKFIIASWFESNLEKFNEGINELSVDNLVKHLSDNPAPLPRGRALHRRANTPRNNIGGAESFKSEQSTVKSPSKKTKPKLKPEFDPNQKNVIQSNSDFVEFDTKQKSIVVYKSDLVELDKEPLNESYIIYDSIFFGSFVFSQSVEDDYDLYVPDIRDNKNSVYAGYELIIFND